MSQVTHDNRRIHSRQPAGIPGQIVHESDECFGTIENVGGGGLFFSTTDLELTVDDGDTVTVTFDITRRGSRETVERTGTVLRAERYFDGSAVVRALAVKFDTMLDIDGIEFK